MSTQRTAAALEALFPDNTAREITAERLRDFLESCIPSYGALDFDEPGAATPIATVSTWTKAANTTTVHTGAHRFSQATDNRLTYDGVTSVIAHAFATLAVTSAAAGKTYSFAIAVNGVVEESSRSTVTLATTDTHHVAVALHVGLAPDDYLELYVRNDTDATDPTITSAHLTAFAFLI